MPALIAEVAKSSPTTQRFGMIQPDSYTLVELDHPIHNLPAGSLQQFLDLYLQSHPNTKIDYVHGDETVDELGRKPGNIGFFLPLSVRIPSSDRSSSMARCPGKHSR